MTRHQLRSIINRAHYNLHTGNLIAAHEILHEGVGDAGSMTTDPEVQEACRHMMEAAAGKMPCGHEIADLVWSPGSVTQCGACLQDRQSLKGKPNPKRQPIIHALGLVWEHVKTAEDFNGPGAWLYEAKYGQVCVACGYNNSGPVAWVGCLAEDKWIDSRACDGSFMSGAQRAIEMAKDPELVRILKGESIERFEVVAMEDDCAPDARESFEREFIRRTGMITRQFRENGKVLHQWDSDWRGYQIDCWKLSHYADDPYWRLEKQITPGAKQHGGTN